MNTKWNRKYGFGPLRWLFLVGLLIASVSSSYAQQITGTIDGDVKDEQGALVPNAVIIATNVTTGFTRTTKSGADGGFNIQYLPVGTYSVTVNAAGFKKFVQQNLVISVDQTQALSVTLSVGAESQTIEVTTAPPLINTTPQTSAELSHPRR